MKRILIAILALALCAAAVGCGGTDEPASSDPTPVATTTTTKAEPPTMDWGDYTGMPTTPTDESGAPVTTGSKQTDRNTTGGNQSGTTKLGSTPKTTPTAPVTGSDQSHITMPQNTTNGKTNGNGGFSSVTSGDKTGILLPPVYF